MATVKEKLIAEASKLVQKAQYDKAVKAYLKVVADDDKDVRTWLKIGDLYAKLNRTREAAETYQRVAQLYIDTGFYKYAVAVYRQILKLEPRNVDVIVRLAELLRQMGANSDAAKEYRNVEVHWQREGQPIQALEALKQIVDLEPANVERRIELAESYSKQQRAHEAIEEFSKAAELLIEQGRMDAYVKVAERLLFHAPENLAVSRQLARVYLERSDARRALPLLQVCFKADARDVDTLRLLAEAFDSLGQTNKMVSVLHELARILSDNGAVGEREETYRKILAHEPNNAEALRALGIRRAPAPAASSATLPFPSPSPSQSPSDTGRGAPPPIPRSEGVAQQAVPKAAPEMDSGPIIDAPSARFAIMMPQQPEGRAAPPAPEPQQRRATPPNMASTGGTDARMAAAGDGPLSEADIERLFAEADVLAHYRLYPNAITHLRGVLERAPDHLRAHEKLKTLLVANDDKQGALAELRFLVERDPARAGELLREMVTLEPGNEWAMERLAPPGVSGRSAGGPPELAPPGMLSGGGEPELRDLDELASSELGFNEGNLLEELSDVPLDHPSVTRSADESALPRIRPSALSGGMFEVGAGLGAGAAADADGGSDDGIEELEFPVVVEDSRPGDSPFSEAGPVEVEDRFGADLDEPQAPLDAAAEEAAAQAPPVAPHEELEETSHGPPASFAPPADEVANFDFGEPAALPDPADHAYGAGTLDGGGAPAWDAADPVAALDPSPLDEPLVDATQTRDSDDIASEEAARQAQAFEPAPGDDLFADEAPVEEFAVEDAFVAEEMAHPDAAAAAGDDALPPLEDELDEADFYLQQGMIDEARSLLDALARQHPDHPAVLARLGELPTDDLLPGAVPEQPVGGDSLDDLNIVLDVADHDLPILPKPETTIVSADPGARDPKKNVIVQGVTDDDFESHYDLGMMYKEMGMLDEAIAEFQRGMGSARRLVQCRLMLGLCFMSKELVVDAIEHFKQGLYADGIQDHEELALYYELGLAYEQLGDPTEALYYYDRIRKRDAEYRDVAVRIAALRSDGDDFGGDTFVPDTESAEAVASRHK